MEMDRSNRSRDLPLTISEDSPTPRTLVLVGRTRNGKSTTGNSILGGKYFTTRVGSSSVTRTTEMKTTTYENRAINVIDTPGLPDDKAGLEATRQEIVKLAGDGIHAVLLVFSVKTLFLKEEEWTLESLKSLFGPKITDYIIIVFTGGDELEENEETIEEYLGPECPLQLQRILEACKGRYVLLDNKTKDEKKMADQLQAVIELVDKVVEANDGQPLIIDSFLKAKEATKVRSQQEQIDSSQGCTKSEPADVKTQIQIQELEEKLRKQSTETLNQIERQKLISLEQQLAEKQAAQKKLEEEECRSDDKRPISERKHKKDIKRLEREIEMLRRQLQTRRCITL